MYLCIYLKDFFRISIEAVQHYNPDRTIIFKVFLFNNKKKYLFNVFVIKNEFFFKKKNIYQILKFLNNNYIFKNFFQFILKIH